MLIVFCIGSGLALLWLAWLCFAQPRKAWDLAVRLLAFGNSVPYEGDTRIRMYSLPAALMGVILLLIGVLSLWVS